MRSGLFIHSILGLMVCGAFASSARADQSFFATANVEDFGNGCGDFGGGGGRSSASISAGFACPGASAAAFSRAGHVGVTEQVSGFASVRSIADFTTDVVFVPQNGQAAGAIPIQLNLAFGGGIDIAGPAAAGYDVTVDIASVDFVRSTELNSASDPTHGSVTLNFSQGGEIDDPFNAVIGGVLTTPQVIVLLNTPVSITFHLGIQGIANTGSLEALFEHSLDFVQGQDLFILPDGYTAEDPEAFVFDNRFLPPDAAGGVPEPASWALMIAGFGLAGATLRRRRALAG